MNKELEFPWNNFIGPHIKKPLKFLFIDESKREWDYELFGVDGGSISEKYEDFYFEYDLLKPLIVDPKSLSDEELQYIFGVNFKVNRKDHLVYLRECRINLNTGYMHPCDQQILNRFYSLHSLPNYEELLKAGIIEDAGDCYE